MSIVTNAILHLGGKAADGKSLIAEVNRFFEEDDGTGFVLVDNERLPRGWYGGGKMLEAWLAIGAFHQLDLDALVEHLRTIDWPYPGDVQLIVREQEEDRFRMINVFEETE
jgi:hypothetical protein